MPKLTQVFWLAIVLEAAGIGWILARSSAMGARRYDAGGEGAMLLGLAIAMTVLLAADAALFHYSKDRRIRWVATGVLLASFVLPAARVLSRAN